MRMVLIDLILRTLPQRRDDVEDGSSGGLAHMSIVQQALHLDGAGPAQVFNRFAELKGIALRRRRIAQRALLLPSGHVSPQEIHLKRIDGLEDPLPSSL